MAYPTPGMLPSETFGFTGGAAPQGTFQYQQIDPNIYNRLFQEDTALLSGIPSGHLSHRRWGGKYRRWGDWWSKAVESSLGLGSTEALDPLARLQSQLQGQLTGNYFEPLPRQYVASIQNMRDKAMLDALRQREAQMGTPGLYGGLQQSLDNAREVLVDQAMAQYDPLRWEAKQQSSAEIMQLLKAINEAEIETKQTVSSAGTLPY